MYIGDFINFVKKMRQAQTARRNGDQKAAIEAWQLEKEVDRGLAEGITVIEPVEDATAHNIMNSENEV